MPPNPELERSAFDVLVLVTSVGSGDALSTVMAGLPDVPPVALVLGQHLGADDALQELLNCHPRYPVRWAQGGTLLEAGNMYVGMPQTLLEVQPNHRFSVAPLQGEEQSDCPLDRLLTSLANSYGARVLAVVLAGEGSDGTIGIQAISDAGGTVLALHPETAACADLPTAVIEAGVADLVVPLHDLGRVVTELLTGKSSPVSMAADVRTPPSGRGHAQEALYVTERLQFTLFDALDQGVCLFERLPLRPDGRRDYRYVAMNPAMQAMFGVQDLSGQSIRDHFPDEVEAWYDDYDRVLDTGESIRFERESEPQGMVLEMFVTRVDDGSGQKLLAVMQDVSGRRRASANLAFLAEVSADLVGLTNIGATMDALGAKLGRHFHATRCAFFEFNETLDGAVCDFDWHQAGESSLVGSYRTSDFYTDEFLQIMRAGKTFVVRDRDTDPRVDPAALAPLHIASYIVVPIAREKELRFALSVYDARPREWQAGDVELIREITTRLWARLERARAEEALRESEVRRDLALETAELGTYVWHAREDRTEADARLLALFGRSEETQATFAYMLDQGLHPDDRAAYVDVISRAMDPAGDGRLKLDFRVVHPDKSVHWMASTGQALFAGQPRQAVRIIGTVADITERKQAEQRQVFLLELSDALRAEGGADGVANRALGLLAEHLCLDRCYIGVYRLEDDWGDFTHQVGNDRVPPVPSGVRLSDFPDALRVSFDSTLVIDDVARDERLSEIDRQSIRGLGVGALVAATLRKGEKYPLWAICAVTASPRRWTSGETSLIEEVAERTWAATARVQAENARRDSEERFRAVANLVPDLLWESGPGGETTWYNERWLEYTGQSFEEAIGWGWADAIHPEDRENSVRRYREAVTAGQSLRQEHRIGRQGGEYRWFAVDTVPVIGERGQVVKAYGSATDIHDLRTMNAVLEARVEDRTQRLTDLNSELRTLATASSEEINEPLRRLRGFLHLLEGRVAQHLDDKTRRYFDLVQGEAVRAERLAEDFKALAYLEHRDLKSVLVPLVTLVLQVRSDLAPRLVRQTATWTVGPLPVVTGDAMLLRQAFTELLHHCLKLVPEGNKAEVEVNASSADGRVTILVEVAPVKAGAGDLRGDGLSTARRVMQRHGGTLETELQGEHLQILLQLPDQSG